MSAWRHRVAATGLAAAALAGCLGLHPQWWWMWLAPVPLLMLAVRGGCRGAVLWSTIAALVGGASWLPYMDGLQGVPVALLAWLVTALRWGAVVGGWRWIVGRQPRRSAPWVYAIMWVAAETLVSAATDNGSWGSLALTQMDDLPVLQVASLFGGPGIVFVVSLGAATLACAWSTSGGPAARALAVGWPVLLIGCVVAAGSWRLVTQPKTAMLRVGMAAIDLSSDAPPADRQAVWQGYVAKVAALAASGAQVVVLPEKIETLVASQAVERAAVLSAVARRAGVTVVAGVALDGGGLRNTAWQFAADGTTARYDKHRLVPGWEDAFVAGAGVTIRSVAGRRAGVAVCRDLDDTSVARDYARAGVAVLLVPAWDFGNDDWMHARIAVLRGAEHGYAVVRSARRGLMTVSDRLGRVVAEEHSHALPGGSIVADLSVPAGGGTPYARWHDGFAWLCVAAAAIFVCRAALVSRRPHPTIGAAESTDS